MTRVMKRPEKIQPMLAYLVDEPFDDPAWLFETKWDGYRAIADVQQDTVELYSRTFQSFVHRFAPIVAELKKLGIDAIFDGEIVILNKSRVSDFQALQNYQKTGQGDLHYFVFDLLYLNGLDLRDLPLIERKAALEKLLPKSGLSKIQYSPHVFEKGKKFFASAQKNKLEGMIAKEIQSRYASRRSRSWLKIKVHARQEFIICGFTAPRGSRKHFGALLLGFHEKGKLRYSGHVGGGFNEKSLAALKSKLEPLVTTKCPYEAVPKTNEKAFWVKPKLICEVSFAEWTQEGILRQPIFMGLRTDKKPKEVTQEVSVPRTGVPQLTHLDKVYFPKEGYTKGDLLEYYDSVAPYMLPYLKQRPVSLYRLPNGIDEQGFFQKNLDAHTPDWVSTITVQHGSKTIRYLTIPDKNTLLYAVNLGSIDIHAFNSHSPTLENPDYLVIDLDPLDISFAKVIETAQTVHELLEKHAIPNFCKTSGATGLHIFVPAGAQYSHEIVKQFAQLLVEIVNSQLPKITSVERMPENRKRKVYLDFLQNNFGQTMAVPYCVRPKPGAPVSMPLDWKEVKDGLDPLDFTIKNALERAKKKKDLFKGVLGKGVDLMKCLKKLGQG